MSEQKFVSVLTEELIDEIGKKHGTSLSGWEWSGDIIERNGYADYEFAYDIERAVLARQSPSPIPEQVAQGSGLEELTNAQILEETVHVRPDDYGIKQRVADDFEGYDLAIARAVERLLATQSAKQAPVAQEVTQQAAKAETAEQALLGEILSLAELGVSYGLLADDYCSHVAQRLRRNQRV